MSGAPSQGTVILLVLGSTLVGPNLAQPGCMKSIHFSLRFLMIATTLSTVLPACVEKEGSSPTDRASGATSESTSSETASRNEQIKVLRRGLKVPSLVSSKVTASPAGTEINSASSAMGMRDININVADEELNTFYVSFPLFKDQRCTLTYEAVPWKIDYVLVPLEDTSCEFKQNGKSYKIFPSAKKRTEEERNADIAHDDMTLGHSHFRLDDFHEKIGHYNFISAEFYGYLRNGEENPVLEVSFDAVYLE